MKNRGKLIIQCSVSVMILICLGLTPMARQSGTAWHAIYPGMVQANSPQDQPGPLVVGLNNDLSTLDPALSPESTGRNEMLVATQMLDTLVSHDPGGSLLKPSLAESWDISSDGMTWTFNLRPGVVFQDGEPLDAEAVLFNFERWWDPANPYHEDGFEYFMFFFGGFKGDEECWIADIYTNGSSQVAIEMTEPYMTVPTMLAMPAFGIASPANIQAGNVDTSPIGSGPYQFMQWTAGDSITLQANPHYWGRAPFVDNLTFKILSDDTARFNALLNGTIHSAYSLPEGLVSSAAGNQALRLGWQGVNTGYLGMNRGHAYLNDPLVRQAIAHAINRPELIDNLYTAGDLVASQLLPPVVWGHKPDLQGYSYDPELSKSLLEQAGYTLPINTTLAYRDVFRAYLPDPAGTAFQIAAELEAIGIHAEVTGYDASIFLTKYYNGELDLFLLGWVIDYMHPDNYFSGILCDPNNLGFGPFDTALCANVQASLEESNLDQQKLEYQAISQQVHNTLPLLPLAHTRMPLFYRAELGGLGRLAAGSGELQRRLFRQERLFADGG